MKTSLLLVCLLLAMPLLYAISFTSKGVSYLSTGANTLAVCNATNTAGIVSLPATVFYEGVEFSVTSIADSAFAQCFDLTDVALPATITSIGEAAFSGCVRLSKVIVPASVSHIGKGAFMGCLDSIGVEPSNVYYSSLDGILFNRAKTVLMQCPTSKSGLFTVPPSVSNITKDAFWNCSKLTGIVVSGTVEAIESGTFWNCKGLTSINSYATIAPDLKDTTVFFNVPQSTCNLCVPVGSLNAYLSVSGWGAFSHVQDNLVVTDLPEKRSRPEVLYLQACQQVRFLNIDAEQRVSIFNNLGKLVRTGKAVDLEHQSLGNLPTGLYFLLLHDGNSSRTFKIVL